MKTFSLKKKTASLHGLRYGKHLQPSRDWLVLLVIGLILLAVSIGYHVWFFSRVTSGESLEPVTTTIEPGSANLESANEVFRVREAVRAQYLNTYRFVDPSR